MKLLYHGNLIFLNYPPISNHLYPLQVENCDSNSRLVVDEDDNGKFKLERFKLTTSYQAQDVETMLVCHWAASSSNQHWVKSMFVCLFAGEHSLSVSE